MVTLYVGGQKIGTWAESEQRVAELAAQHREIELRDETESVIARVIPRQADDPDWVKAITPEEVERRLAHSSPLRSTVSRRRTGNDVFGCLVPPRASGGGATGGCR